MDLIDLALKEDIGNGDLTSLHFIQTETQAYANLTARANCVLAGTETVIDVFHRVDPLITIKVFHHDGATLKPGDIVLNVSGSARSILTAERTAINFVQHLSGIATHTHKFVSQLSGTKTTILDTRKTIPGMRLLEKKAVAAGGGKNHRMGLYDMVMIKDNHLEALGSLDSLQQHIHKFKAQHPNIKIEIEADTIKQVETFVELEGIDLILLDNMQPATIREALALRKGSIQFEASGGIQLENVREFAKTGVDFISIGALTHSAPAIDFGLDFTFKYV